MNRVQRGEKSPPVMIQSKKVQNIPKKKRNKIVWVKYFFLLRDKITKDLYGEDDPNQKVISFCLKTISYNHRTIT